MLIRTIIDSTYHDFDTHPVRKKSLNSDSTRYYKDIVRFVHYNNITDYAKILVFIEINIQGGSTGERQDQKQVRR